MANEAATWRPRSAIYCASIFECRSRRGPGRARADERLRTAGRSSARTSSSSGAGHRPERISLVAAFCRGLGLQAGARAGAGSLGVMTFTETLYGTGVRKR